MKEKNWTLSNGLSARQCEHELALTENNGVVDIVETPQLNPYEQARAQRIAELQAQLAPLEVRLLNCELIASSPYLYRHVWF